jgi:hypothetical protein
MAEMHAGGSGGPILGGGERENSPLVALGSSGTRAEESHQRQAEEGVKAGVEVDIEVHGTQAELVAVSTGPESGWRRPAPAMQPQGRNKMAPGSAWLALSDSLNAEKSHEVDQASSGIRAWGSGASAAATASGARHAAEQRRGKMGLGFSLRR